MPRPQAAISGEPRRVAGSLDPAPLNDLANTRRACEELGGST